MRLTHSTFEAKSWRLGTLIKYFLWSSVEDIEFRLTNKSFSLSKCLYKFCHSRMIQSIILFLMFHSPPSVSISELDFDEYVVTYYCRSIGTDCMPSCSTFSCMHRGSWYKILYLSTNRSCNRIACWSKEQDQLPLMLYKKYVLYAYLHFRKGKLDTTNGV